MGEIRIVRPGPVSLSIMQDNDISPANSRQDNKGKVKDKIPVPICRTIELMP